MAYSWLDLSSLLAKMIAGTWVRIGSNNSQLVFFIIDGRHACFQSSGSYIHSP